MATDESLTQHPTDRLLVRGGISYRLGAWLGLEPPTPWRRVLKVLLLVVLTWLPLVILSALKGHAWRGQVSVPLMFDPVVHTRFLFVVPLLELAEIFVEKSLRAQIQHFLESGLIPHAERPRFAALVARINRLRSMLAAEGAIVVLAILVSITIRAAAHLGIRGTSWQREGTIITPAGWWYILVSLPILYYYLLCWFWVFVLWAGFLFRVSRLNLELTPTHPDRAGGLGFLGWGMASFAIILLAVSAVISGGLAREIIHGGSSLNSVKYHVILFVVLAIGVLYAPLLVFTGRLARCRFRGLLDFGTLIWIHDHDFDEKWIKTLGSKGDSLLGSRDATSLGAISRAYEHVDNMLLVPFDKKALMVLILAAVIPMIPLLGTELPFMDILKALGEFMV
jgi:hypothetical protein